MEILMKSQKRKEKGLSAWQLTMIALGTVIGGSFFLGSAVAVNAAGPAILVSYIFGGVMVYFILFALSEMTVANPCSGSFRTFAAEAFGNGTGFVMGWVYWTGMVLAMSSEATAISILVRVWFPDISIPILGACIIVAVTLLNLLGANKLSHLESGLAAIKILTVISFIVMAILLVIGLFPGKPAVGTAVLKNETFFSGGIEGLGGSLLLVMFAYAGFEIIGLAAAEANNPKVTIPRAIRYTVISLTGLYILSAAALLFLIPTADLNANTSPMVAALNRNGITWFGGVINVVLITAVFSTMLTAMFGLGRMMRSLADESLAPRWLKDNKEVPYRGIIFSGLSMMIGFGISLLFPQVYLFLTSSAGFSILFTYVLIMATHIKFRKKNGKADHDCILCGFPFSSIAVLIFLVAAIVCMPFVSGQASGLIAGILLLVFYILAYLVMKAYKKVNKKSYYGRLQNAKSRVAVEISKELSENSREDKDMHSKDDS
jgi:L-asparagine transporter-like permease